MAPLPCRSLLMLMTVILCLFCSASYGQGSGNTAANPYCNGDARFANVNCPTPGVCYFKDRLGTPACCPAGQICQSAPNNPPPFALNGAVPLRFRFRPVTKIMGQSRATDVSSESWSTVPIQLNLSVGDSVLSFICSLASVISLPIVLMVWHIF